MTTHPIDKTNFPVISWSAVFAGGLTALAVAIMLNLLGLGIGFASINPVAEAHPFSGIGIGTLIWWGVSNIIALLAGGMVAGRMAGYISKTDGGVHGFLSWCLYAAVSIFFLVTIIGSIIGGITGTVSSIFSGNQNKKVVVRVNNQQQQQQQPSTSFQDIRNKVLQLVEKGERYNILPDDASENVNRVLDEGIANFRQTWQQLNLDRNISEFFNDLTVSFKNGNLDISVKGDYLDKQGLKNYLAQNTDLSKQEINQKVNYWERKIEQAIDKVQSIYRDAKQKLVKFSAQLTDALATFSLIAFFVLLLGAIAAWGGGMVTARSNPALDEDNNNRRREETLNPE